MMQKEIRQTWHFNQTPEKVWEYLTIPELLEQWLMPNDFQPRVGHKFRFFFTQGKDGKPTDVQHYCEVLELIPFEKLSYSWKKDDMSRISKVSWTLLSKDKGTELQLVHDGFVDIEPFNSHKNGWPVVGSRLIDLLNKLTK